jgi:hypothetical protein
MDCPECNAKMQPFTFQGRNDKIGYVCVNCELTAITTTIDVLVALYESGQEAFDIEILPDLPFDYSQLENLN